MPFDIASLLDTEDSVIRLGLIVERGGQGVRANVPHILYHSLDGFDFGQNSLKASELSLSTLCALIPPPSPEEEDRLYSLSDREFDIANANDALWSVRTPKRVRISRLAWRLHYSFKKTFIVTMKEDYGHIPAEILQSWIEVQARMIAARS